MTLDLARLRERVYYNRMSLDSRITMNCNDMLAAADPPWSISISALRI